MNRYWWIDTVSTVFRTTVNAGGVIGVVESWRARTIAETKRGRMGIDVEALREVLGSHHASHTALTKVLDEAAPGRDDTPDGLRCRRQRDGGSGVGWRPSPR